MLAIVHMTLASALLDKRQKWLLHTSLTPVRAQLLRKGERTIPYHSPEASYDLSSILSSDLITQ